MSNLNITKSVEINGMSYVLDLDMDSNYPDRYSRQVKARMYVWNKDEGFNLFESIMARGSEPHRWYRKFILPLADEILSENGYDGLKYRWSAKAGCSCPCSPGYIVTGLEFKSIWVKFRLDDELLFELDKQIKRWDSIARAAYDTMHEAGNLPWQINAGWTPEEQEEARKLSEARAPNETATYNMARKTSDDLRATRKDRVKALYASKGKEQVKGDETHRSV